MIRPRVWRVRINRRIYRCWHNMWRRCTDPEARGYKHYGGKGITVAAEWKRYDSFHEWAVSHGYMPELTLDRIDFNKGYSPENCRWATTKEQALNRADTISVTYQGKTKTLVEWCEELGLNHHKTWSRLRRRKMKLEDVFSKDNLCNRQYLSVEHKCIKCGEITSGQFRPVSGMCEKCYRKKQRRV